MIYVTIHNSKSLGSISCLLGLNYYIAADKMSCPRTQHCDSGESRPPDKSVRVFNWQPFEPQSNTLPTVLMTSIRKYQNIGITHVFSTGRVAQSRVRSRPDPILSWRLIMIILLPSAESFKKGCCQLQAKACARSTACSSLPRKKVWLGELTVLS